MIEITHITKPDRHDIFSRIREVGAMSGGVVLWRRTLDDAITQTRFGTQYFVRRGGVSVLVERVEGTLLSGGAYLRTVPDLTGANNLLSLPELPMATDLGFGQVREYHNALARSLYGAKGFGK